MGEQLHLTIDTREQQPWSFRDLAVCSRGTLRAGDYAVSGDPGFAVERKSLDDFAGTLSSGWQRFGRELFRMTEAGFPARVIIVEAEWSDVIEHRYNHPDVPPAMLLRRVAELTMDGVTVLFGGNPVACAGLCWRILLERQARMAAAEGEG